MLLITQFAPFARTGTLLHQLVASSAALGTVCDVIITGSIVYFLRAGRSEQPEWKLYEVSFILSAVQTLSSLTGGDQNLFNRSEEYLSIVGSSLGKPDCDMDEMC
ncbi:hypothetical protein JVT61DRAFT_2300 [Boletus reticuloceps]|uniref:Uncharacterized protein n=1 Tax=Boletus reticuloceps TaxID=495285 RepID=A0A8I2YQS4_9AGAM|nr:hypothetical protein JVT61DRAFT_2300 [Boletus reticuloceps]